ncbi:MAG: response regulator transcription factor [Clostridia bacterium]|nr:response regulator transcription factor [Clostridia bacterium]
MRVAIVDDDCAMTAQLSDLISEELAHLGDRGFKITVFHSGEDFLASFEKGAFDLIFLDIFMKELTGIDVAYQIRKEDTQVMIAFCTSSNDYASESYDVGARHYLRKPITRESISKMFKRLDLDAIEKRRTVKLPDGNSVILRDILYTDYENHVITLHIKNRPPHRLRTSQTEIESLLLPYGFFCSPYKGITVNFYAVKELSDSEIVLSDGTVLPVTRRKTKDVKEAYKKFKFEQMRKEVGG